MKKSFKVFSLIVNLLLILLLLYLPFKIIPAARNLLNFTIEYSKLISRPIGGLVKSLQASSEALASTSDGLRHASVSISNSIEILDQTSGFVDQLGDEIIAGSVKALDRVETSALIIDQTFVYLEQLGLVKFDEDQLSNGLSDSINELNQVLENSSGEFDQLADALRNYSEDGVKLSESLEEIAEDASLFNGEIKHLTNDLSLVSSDLERVVEKQESISLNIPVLTWGIFGLLIITSVMNILILIFNVADEKTREK